MNCQERSKPELLASLREALSEAIAFNKADALSAAGDGYTEERIAV